MSDLAKAIKMLEKAQFGFQAIAKYAGGIEKRKDGESKGFDTFEQVRDFANSRASYIKELLQTIEPK